MFATTVNPALQIVSRGQSWVTHQVGKVSTSKRLPVGRELQLVESQEGAVTRRGLSARHDDETDTPTTDTQTHTHTAHSCTVLLTK